MHLSPRMEHLPKAACLVKNPTKAGPPGQTSYSSYTKSHQTSTKTKFNLVLLCKLLDMYYEKKDRKYKDLKLRALEVIFNSISLCLVIFLKKK